MIDHVLISVLKDKHDSAPRRSKVEWLKFSEAFRKVRLTTCLIENCKRGSECAYKDGRSWSPAVYPPNTPRKKIFVEDVSLLVIDLDHLTDEQLAAATAPLTPYQRILHASHSDRPPGCTICTCGSEPGALHGQRCPSRVDRCIRAIVALSRPVTRDEWPRFWPTAMAQLKQPADPSCCDANRLYYMPSRPKDGGTSYLFEVHEGIALDVEAILAIAPPDAPSLADGLQLDASGVVEPGMRHAMLKSIAGALRFRGAGYSEIEAALLGANKARCNPPKSDGEVRAIAKWAAESPVSTLPSSKKHETPPQEIQPPQGPRLQHDPDAAIDFLAWAYPEGPWCLTAVEVDSPRIATATFFPTNAEAVRTFLQDHARWNIYWSVNRPMSALSKRAEKTDIAAVHFLHVDIDMKKVEESERERILKLLSKPPPPIQRPTAVIFSGGGYQALWRLAEPFVIDGDIGKAEELESYNRQLEWSFGADACHNVDRILRLVGSVNFPSAKKRGKGRRVERAVLV